jgi:hypothetical protein
MQRHARAFLGCLTLTAIGVGLAAVSPATAVAQEPRPIAAGDRVRVILDKGLQIDGRFERSAPDSIWLYWGRSRVGHVTRDRGIRRVDVIAGPQGAPRSRRALVGGAVGLGIGFLLGAATGGDGGAFFTRAETGVMLGTVSGLIGLVVGAVSGNGERWQPVPLETLMGPAAGR